MKKLLFILIILLCGSIIILAQQKNIKRTSSLNDRPIETYLNMNNISTTFYNNGFSDVDSTGNNADFIYPKGSGKTAIYQSGLVFGDSTSNGRKVGGSTYNSGLQPGWTEKFYSVFSTDSNTCWAAGNNGLILKTTNGGYTWNKEITHVSNDLHSIYFADSNTGWAVGSGGIILNTSDGGLNWNKQSSSTSDTLFSVQFINANTGWAVGSKGIILHTTNGNDWSSQPDQNTNNLNSVYFVNKDSGLTVGSNGTILYTVNGGAIWGKITSGINSNLYSVGIVTSLEKAYAVGEGGSVVSITNGSIGYSNLGINYNLNSLFLYAPDTVGWAVGDHGTIISSIQSGKSWIIQTSNTKNNLNSVHFTDSKYGWAAGDMGTILRTTDGGESWVNKIPTRIFRVRPDVYPGGPQVDLSAEAADEGETQEEIRSQYEADWEQWPAYMGAPFQDKNHDGIYEPDIDVPGVAGAAQTIWFMANDFNINYTLGLYGSSPMGMEYQATIWEYDDSTGFNNFLFRKYKLINQSKLLDIPSVSSSQTWQNMYVSMFSDIDIGNAGDDFAGCDTALNLGYGYNGEDVDASYSPLPPPAVGFSLIRGPFVKGKAGEDLNRNGIDDQNDYGWNQNNVRIKGYINLPMTAFYYFSQKFPSPSLGTYNGTLQFYNYLQGKDISGSEFINPVTNSPTTFALSGNPITGTGWVDGVQETMGDRSIGISTGPFQMAPGDTQVVVFAQIAAGAEKGVSRLMAVDSLMHYSIIAQQFYDGNEVLPVELITFTANNLGDKVELEWQTATELNDYGFEVERSSSQVGGTSPRQGWINVGFVKGAGNSSSLKKYTFTDLNPGNGNVEYRLKQIDYNGTFKYSNTVDVNLSTPTKFTLYQNYPNPFNPTTTIKYEIPKAAHVTLKVYDILGNVVETLVNKLQQAGRYSVQFAGGSRQLASGVYIYRLQAGSYSAVKKLVLLK